MISNTLWLLQFFLLILQVFSEPREPRLLGATQLTKEQITANHKGSASVALGYSNSEQKFLIGAVLAPDTFLAWMFISGTVQTIIASNLLQPTVANPTVADGEVYPTDGPLLSYNGDPYIQSVKFGPLKADTKAVPATLAPAGTPPLPAATTGCIAYTYGPITEGDTNPENYKLGYLPLTVLANTSCGFTPDEKEKYFCATVSSPDGKAVFCNTADKPLVAFCPVSTFGNVKTVTPNPGEDKEKWCRLWWWFWWCHEEDLDEPVDEPEEEKWVLVGLYTFTVMSTHCGVDNHDAIAFYYTKITN